MPDRARLLHGCRKLDCFKRALTGWDRRYGINFVHLWNPHPRIELRYHQGTMNVERARHWFRLWNRILEHAITRNCQAGKQVRNNRKSFDALRYTVGLRSNAGIYSKVSPELRETSKYLLKRWRQFNEQGMV